MRVAVLADIHGNIDALEAVLEDIQKQHVDQIVVAGDVVIGLPHSLACWQRLRSLGCPIIRGNHERYLFALETPDAPESWKTKRYAPIHQAYQQFSKHTIEGMRQLPLYHHSPDLLIIHASFRDDQDTIKPETPASELDGMFNGSSEPFIIRAHNHVWFDCAWQKRTLYSVGSVGLPLNGDRTAQYGIAEKTNGKWAVARQDVSYDIEKAIRSFEKTDYFEIAGSVGKLFRQELLTAKHQLTPFWRAYSRAIDDGEVTLEQAVSHYLNS